MSMSLSASSSARAVGGPTVRSSEKCLGARTLHPLEEGDAAGRVDVAVASRVHQERISAIRPLKRARAAARRHERLGHKHKLGRDAPAYAAIVVLRVGLALL
eukprot:scaffold83097_cov69-Phaeocystis_antarctica.AAC.10